ncbi:hypothetical protein B5P44_01225 [Mycobacterium sp. CBMA 213]|uniref:Uncharacterized protein n=1 Tax=Mycolicibacterium sp. CBMA 213 TaxID=1968788 RepID=A0A343VRN9_9MYCO|nr:MULTISPECIES: hypothetical protein [unclassified Mycolicibacterium]AVN58563.1 hypothetical protein B5P44_p00268 [Mycolicibacterium sp. CBMA 213]MUL61205.1 hypothetical protein [Mycolicibacterium sp. CBMA 335]MUM03442.1 hypothetical protein [Mycolicibacterium sp. CBMA 213]
MFIDIAPGCIVIHDAGSILGHSDDLQVSPERARQIAAELDAKGEHTVAAEGLRRAADQAEGKR